MSPKTPAAVEASANVEAEKDYGEPSAKEPAMSPKKPAGADPDSEIEEDYGEPSAKKLAMSKKRSGGLSLRMILWLFRQVLVVISRTYQA